MTPTKGLPATVTTPVVSALVALLLPDYPHVDTPVRRKLLADVTAYVVAQIDAMPRFLRVPYRAMLTLFEYLPVLRFASRFSLLPRQRQAGYLRWWTALPLPPLRDFLKLIRSTALFVYFDHPLLQPRLETEAGFLPTEAASVE